MLFLIKADCLQLIQQMVLKRCRNNIITCIKGTSFGFDFNPTIDRIRVVIQVKTYASDLGTVVLTDGNLNPGTPFVNRLLMRTNFVGATTTTLFVVDSQTDMLYRQEPLMMGVLVAVGKFRN
jgi:hypothetical protein